ncbi:hypothetical protein SCA6_009848 [Theobroma cacao]
MYRKQFDEAKLQENGYVETDPSGRYGRCGGCLFSAHYHNQIGFGLLKLVSGVGGSLVEQW